MKQCIFLLLAISILSSSCNKQKQIDQIAQEFCSCMKPVLEMYDQASSLNSEDELDAISDAVAKMEKAANESEQCAKQIEKKYGNLADRDEEIQAAMQRVCPDLMQKMSEIENVE